MKPHLTSEDYSKWMIGERTPEHEEHLRRCADCAAELENIQAPLRLFRGAVRDWSADQRVKAAQRTQVAGSVNARPAHPLWVRFATAGVALALAIAMGVGGSNWRQADTLRREQRAEREDEALLGNIQAAVMRPVPATMQPVYNLMARENAPGSGLGSRKEEAAK